MAYYCSGICKRYKSKGGYLKGNKKCRMCKIFIKYDKGYFCPCCGFRLKSKPRGSKSRKKLAEKIENYEKRI